MLKKYTSTAIAPFSHSAQKPECNTKDQVPKLQLCLLSDRENSQEKKSSGRFSPEAQDHRIVWLEGTL